jgi:hypothetical protein
MYECVNFSKGALLFYTVSYIQPRITYIIHTFLFSKHANLVMFIGFYATIVAEKLGNICAI